MRLKLLHKVSSALAVVLLLSIALAIPGKAQDDSTDGFEIVFVVDQSLSDSSDSEGLRFEAVKYAVGWLEDHASRHADRRHRVAVINFGSTATPWRPENGDIWLEIGPGAVEDLNLKDMRRLYDANQGQTAIDDALRLAGELFDSAENNNRKAVILISDLQAFEEGKTFSRSMSDIEDAVDGLDPASFFVLGIGNVSYWEGIQGWWEDWTSDPCKESTGECSDPSRNWASVIEDNPTMNRRLDAILCEVVDCEPAEIPSPAATSTLSPAATSTPSPTATSTPSPAATSTPSPTATSTPSPTVDKSLTDSTCGVNEQPLNNCHALEDGHPCIWIPVCTGMATCSCTPTTEVLPTSATPTSAIQPTATPAPQRDKGIVESITNPEPEVLTSLLDNTAAIITTLITATSVAVAAYIQKPKSAKDSLSKNPVRRILYASPSWLVAVVSFFVAFAIMILIFYMAAGLSHHFSSLRSTAESQVVLAQSDEIAQELQKIEQQVIDIDSRQSQIWPQGISYLVAAIIVILVAQIMYLSLRGGRQRRFGRLAANVAESGQNLSGADLQNAKLAGVYLRRAKLRGTDLTKADLTRADLSEARLRGANLTEAGLTGADLTEADLSRASLRGADLTGADLERAVLSNGDLDAADLRWANLTEADLTTADLTRADLRGANLNGAVLNEATLYKANLTAADLRGADLSKAILTRARYNSATQWPQGFEYEHAGAVGPNADLHEAVFEGVDLSGADLRKANLSGAKLKTTDLTRADLRGADLSGGVLEEATLYEANLSEADLSEADLSGAILTRARYNLATQWPQGFEYKHAGAVGPYADLIHADLRRADLEGAELGGAELRGADLRGANLRGARAVDIDMTEVNLNGATLYEANLQGTKLIDARLSKANLSRANLSGVDLSRVNLRGAKLNRANLRGAKLGGADLSEADLSGAIYDDETIWPAGIDPEAEGAIK